MSPTAFLILVLGVTIGAWLVNRLVRARRRYRLRAVALRWQMHYSPHDRFRLAPRIAEHFPVCGAADLLASDVIYGLRDGRHCYVFTADYTEGVVRTKRRRRRVIRYVEPLDPSQASSTAELAMAPTDLRWDQQYEHFAPANVEDANKSATR